MSTTPEEYPEELTAVFLYLSVQNGGYTRGMVANFLAPDAIQIEHPSPLNPSGGTHDLPKILDRFEQRESLFITQSFKIASAVVQGSNVALAGSWSGKLQRSFGDRCLGDTFNANFGMFFELKDELIREQRIYECFEP
jgi:hypothetical protein